MSNFVFAILISLVVVEIIIVSIIGRVLILGQRANTNILGASVLLP